MSVDPTRLSSGTAPTATAGQDRSGPSDVQLIERILAGEESSFEPLMRRYNRFLFRLVRGILKDDMEAEDVVQETYVRVYQQLAQFQGPRGFSSWLARIAINEAYGRFRRFSRAHHWQRIMTNEGRSTSELQSPEAPTGPELFAATRELRGLLEKYIDALPHPYRVVFMLRGVEQLSVTETARCLDIKEATVKTRFHRARRLLRKALKPYISTAVTDAFPFAGERCNRIVRTVYARVSGPGLSRK